MIPAFNKRPGVVLERELVKGQTFKKPTSKGKFPTLIQKKKKRKKERKHMERCSASLNSREMQIKTTRRYYLAPIRMAIIKKSTNKNCWRDVEKREPSHAVGETVNWYSHYGEHYGASLRN